ncbi:MAG: ribonuclease HII [Coriobacteriales bacterium]|nr:ribonuclease HII [Coriobacteriales bacterium]
MGKQATNQSVDERALELYSLQREAYANAVVVGIDEVGRGAVAGPLTVAAVALPLAPLIVGLDDSKKLSAKKREKLHAEIFEQAVAIGIGHVAPRRIDSLGMARALRIAMLEALAKTGLEPDAVLIDGNPVNIHPNERCIIKGDSSVACIAAASIVAKVTRDALMGKFDVLHPQYGLAQNKGYASAKHIEAIKEHGISKIHRKTFCTNFMQESLF